MSIINTICILPQNHLRDFICKRMKVSALLAVFLGLLSLSIAAKSDEDYERVRVSPRVKRYDSNGDVLIAPVWPHRRLIRKANLCKVPTEHTNYQLDCKVYPSRVHCTQTCMFGYTLSDGIQREMKCKYDVNKWEPSPEFETCQPFVDCTVTLGPGGKYKCYTNYMDKGTTCEISCDHYEDKVAVRTQRYECDIDGKWSPKLPFCAKAGTGMKLVSAPKGPKVISKSGA